MIFPISRFSQFSILFILVKAMQCLQCSDSAPFYLTFAKLSRLELFYFGSISVHASMNRQDIPY